MILFQSAKFSIGAVILPCLLSVLAQANGGTVKGPYPHGVPGSGYGCSNQCSSGADVHYVVKAKMEKYTIPGSKNMFKDGRKDDFQVHTRTFVGVDDESSPFCDNAFDGTDGPLGPCLRVNPGQRITIKIENEIDHGMLQLHQHKTTKEGYGFRRFPLMTWSAVSPCPKTTPSKHSSAKRLISLV